MFERVAFRLAIFIWKDYTKDAIWTIKNTSRLTQKVCVSQVGNTNMLSITAAPWYPVVPEYQEQEPAKRLAEHLSSAKSKAQDRPSPATKNKMGI